MPVIIKDYTWVQADNSVTIRVPLRTATMSSVDIFVAEDYLKASFEYFFFECYPYAHINEEESHAIVRDKEIILELKKLTPEIWPTLQATLQKSEQKEIRMNAYSRAQAKLSKQYEDKLSKGYARKREAVTMAIANDAAHRKQIENKREAEKEKALGLVEEWCEESKPAPSKPRTRVMKQHLRNTYQENKAKAPEVLAIPLPRNQLHQQSEMSAVSSVVEVDFTPRVLPTPSRESTEAEEVAWLENQAKARRSAGFASEDIRAEEKNPSCLLAKGETFMQAANYLGAISVYTFGIQIAPKLVDFYIMRSKAHFEVGNLHKCVRDCSDAMEMMKPACYANLSQRVDCIHRRGLALYKLGLNRQAEDELKAAIALQPSRELTRDLYMIQDSPEYVEKPEEKKGLIEIDH